MGSSSKGGTTTSSTTTKPWNIEQLRGVGRAAERMVKRDVGYKPFEDPTYVPFSGQTQQGLNQTEAIAKAGSPITENAVSVLGKTINGDYLNGNPYLMDSLTRGADEITKRSNMSAAGAGRYGSGAAAEVTADSLGDYYKSALMQNYDSERGRQMQAMTLAPTINDMRYGDARTLMGVGQAYEGKAGEVLGDSMQRWNAYQARPWEQLGRLNSIATGAGQLGGTAIQQQPASSPLAGILGGGMAGAGILGNLAKAGVSTGGWGVGLPIAGGLLGAFM
jgi:hypothetical protein